MARNYWKSTSDGDLTVGANLSSGAGLATGETLVLTNSGVSVNGQDLSGSVTVAGLEREVGYSGRVGTPPAGGAAGVPLKLATSASYYIGRFRGVGDADIHPSYEFYSTANSNCTVNVESAAMVCPYGVIPPCNVLTNNASATINILGGWVGVGAQHASETGQFSICNIGFPTASKSVVRGSIGLGITAATVNGLGGEGILECSTGTALNVYAGCTVWIMGTGTHAAITIYNGGVVKQFGTGTITALTVKGTGFFDPSQSNQSFTVTNMTVDGNHNFAGNSRMINTNPIAYVDKGAPGFGGGA